MPRLPIRLAVLTALVVSACGPIPDEADPDIPVVTSLTAEPADPLPGILFQWQAVGGVDGYALRVWGPYDAPQGTAALESDLDYVEYMVSAGDPTSSRVTGETGYYYGGVVAYRTGNVEYRYGSLGNVVEGYIE